MAWQNKHPRFGFVLSIYLFMVGRLCLSVRRAAQLAAADAVAAELMKEEEDQRSQTKSRAKVRHQTPASCSCVMILRRGTPPV